jgi:hypothetical protein
VDYKVKFVQNKPGMDKEYVRDLNTYQSTVGYGKKINSGKSIPVGVSAHSVSGCMKRGGKSKY